MVSEVFFSKLGNGKGRAECLNEILQGIEPQLSQLEDGSFVGIKMTIGDEGSTGYLKPELVRILVDRLKGLGTKPFVFDTNVIYRGQRQNSVDHLNLAYRKGFSPDGIGCPFIVADSVFGTDSKVISMDFRNIKEIRVPSLVGVLDNLIVLSHITGHIMSGLAASVKNVAMGMASRAGKQIQHSSLKPTINNDKCTECGSCISICPVSAISETSGVVYINPELCIGCCECIGACRLDAVNINWHEDANIFAERMAEYACGILSLVKRKIFINFAIDVTKECDCIAGDDPRITDDLGILASTDILAVDRACYDMLAGRRDIFSRGGRIGAHRHLFRYAGEIGLGSTDYVLKEPG